MSRSHMLTGPPPEVLDAVGAAWERAQAPLRDSRELSFESAPSVRRAWGRRRLPDATAVATLPAFEALAIACGDVRHQATSV